MAGKEEEEEKDIRSESIREQITAKKTESVMESEEEKTMTPWEQHSSVISIPRFDYNAPSALLHHSLSGFLITCTIKREKSATKEAMSILQKHIGFCNGYKSACLNRCDENDAAKRRKIFTKNTNSQSVNSGESSVGGILPKDTCAAPTMGDTSVDQTSVLSLVKLTRSGLVLFTFPKDISADTVHIVSNVIHTLESASSSSPLWCHRIFPIQATCCLNEEDLHAVVSNLVLQFLKDKQDKLSRPVKFAVGYNRRGIEDRELKTRKDLANGSDANVLLDRNKCFSIVAGAVKNTVSDSVVDLKSPELSVLVELLPLSRVPLGSLVVGVAVLPSDLVSTKPKLCIKTLVSNSKLRI